MILCYNPVERRKAYDCERIKELKNILSYYADDMEVKVAIDSMIRPLTKVTFGVDMDTNKCSVWLCDDERYRG